MYTMVYLDMFTMVKTYVTTYDIYFICEQLTCEFNLLAPTYPYPTHALLPVYSLTEAVLWKSLQQRSHQL